jgi:hypothetical protein
MVKVWLLDGYALARAATQLTPLVFGRPAPDAGVLTGFERPLEAIPLHRACSAYRLSGLDLRKRWTRGADRKEDLGVDVSAGRTVAPVHRSHLPVPSAL